MSIVLSLILKIQKLVESKSSIVKCIKYPKLLESSLRELDDCVEMNEIKESIVQQIKFYLDYN